ncbi:MAG: hypothetical protein ABI629_16975 [bacterium]
MEGLFLTGWLYERLPEIRATLEKIGATRTLVVLDATQQRISEVPGAGESPEVVLLSDAFNDWCRTTTPASELADETQDCLLAYLRNHPAALDEFGQRHDVPESAADRQAPFAQMEEDARWFQARAQKARQSGDKQLQELIVQMLRGGRRIDAVRAWRTRHRCSLAEASEAVARLAREVGTLPP